MIRFTNHSPNTVFRPCPKAPVVVEPEPAAPKRKRGGGRRPADTSNYDLFRTLWEQGVGIKEIAIQMGLAKGSIAKIRERCGIPPRRPRPPRINRKAA